MKLPTFTDNEYVTKYKLMDDTGRMQVTNKEADAHMWRVPTLRNLEYTVPYMHTGTVKSLEEAEVDDIVAFLGSLNGKFPEQSMPRLPATPGNLLK